MIPMRWLANIPRWLVEHYEAVVPGVLIVLLVQGTVLYQMPGNFCTIDESHEPLQTLRFVSTKGRTVFKWGPVPSFINAPLYAPWLIYWRWTGDLAQPSTDYPYGLAHPFQQQGTLIVTARLAGLVIGVVCVGVYALGLRRLTGSRLAVFLAVVLCVATSPELIYKFVSTKPDGLMIAFLTASMGVYAVIVADGLTRRRGIALAVLATLSVSCKEQTVPAYVLPFLGMLVDGWRRSVGDPTARRRFLADYLGMLAAGVLSYLVVNVVYAPSTWLERLRVVFGPLKDSSIWAGSNWSPSLYLADTGDALLYNFGPGGIAILVVALVVSLRAPVPRKVLLWLPFLGYLVIVVGTAGYMPRYFLAPLNALAATPVAAALAYLGDPWWESAPRPGRVAAVAGLAVLLVLNGWVANFAWARLRMLPDPIIERYCLEAVSRDELIHTANMNPRQPGADRLSLLGFHVDDRSLGEIMNRPAEMPEVILIGREHLMWLLDFRNVPNRDAAFNEWTGHAYSRFEGFEPLGYRLEAVVHPDLPRWLLPPWVPWPWYRVPATADVLVYRRDREVP
jgi:hypothetical protein